MPFNHQQRFRLILASGSPRRRELLAGMGYQAGAELTAAQTVSMQNIILLIPAIMLAVALVANLLYPLSNKKMGEVYAKLESDK